jgi:hypothetical protein
VSRKLRIDDWLQVCLSTSVGPLPFSMAALERLSVDSDEHNRLRPRWAGYPDGRPHRSRAPVEALPHATGRPTIPSARRQLTLAFLEAILPKRAQNFVRRAYPSALLFDPRHPASLVKFLEARHLSHGVLPINLDPPGQVSELAPGGSRGGAL